MAQLLAPYNNSMRLGQGFNSYTQQICLDRAVLPDTPRNTARLEKVVNVTKAIKLTRGKKKAKDETKLASVPASVPASTEVITAKGADQTDSDDGLPPTPAENETEDEEGEVDDDEDEGDDSDSDSQYDDTGITVHPWVKPQIVTYSSRFVDKLSDVTDAMNISGSLSIKTATIGGKASGSYVDSDKFKSSDINFHLQVKVTNQIHNAPNYNIFNKIEDIETSKFPEVYGDSFISGWEEGGELNAIISIKVLDKSKIFQVKASIEAELTTPSIAGKVTAKVDFDKTKLSKETETTIAVNWSGGGSIKHPQKDWSIETLKEAAAAFPECVAIMPQRTYAILTKYTALESFHLQNKTFEPLDYENAGIYTGALLDAYMDYKALWKQISHAIYELEGNRATIDRGEPTEEMAKLATVRDFPLVDKKKSTSKQIEGPPPDTTAEAATVDNQVVIRDSASDALNRPPERLIPTFTPSFAGLIQARKECRFEMSKIVREVDLVSRDPTLSTDPSRDSYFLHPLVFKQLLPIVRSLSPENASLGIRDPTAALLLGYSQPKHETRNLPPLHIFAADITEHVLPLKNSVEKYAHRAADYRMQGCVGPISHNTLHSQAALFNDLEKLDQTYRPSEIAFWTQEQKLIGLRVQYANGEKKSHGTTETGLPTHVLRLAFDGSEVISEVVIRESVDAEYPEISWIESIAVATSLCNVLDTSIIPSEEDEETIETSKDPKKGSQAPSPAASGDQSSQVAEKKEQPTPSTDSSAPKAPIKSPTTRITTWTRPSDSRHSLRGFFGFTHKSQILTLGIIWGSDSFVPVPQSPPSPLLCKNFLALSKNLQTNIRSHDKFRGKSLLGNTISIGAVTEPTEYFNSLDDIDNQWQIRSIGFASSEGKLCGLKVTYRNGTELKHGRFDDKTAKWACEIKTSLCIMRLVAGKKDGGGASYIGTMEFIREDANGVISAWPLHTSTIRYLGEGDIRVSKDISELVETAPKIGNAKWSIRGFYGECTNGVISRLGAIWGHL